MKRSFIVLSSVLIAAPLFAQSQSTNPQSTTQEENTNQNQTTNQENQNRWQNQQYQDQQYQNQNQPQMETNQMGTNQENEANQKQHLSSLAARMINNTTEARNAVQQHNRKVALIYIGRATEDLSQIRSEEPNHRMVPIFTEVSNVWVIRPMNSRAAAQGNMSQNQMSSQGQVTPNQAEPYPNQNQNGQNQNGQWEQNQANPNASNQAMSQPYPTQGQVSGQGQSPCQVQSNQTGQNQWEQNQGTTSNAYPYNNGANGTATSGNTPAPPVVVHGIRGRFTGIWLNTTNDAAHLQAAREAVQRGDYVTANQALDAVQDSLVTETVKADQPLLQARENLVLAREAARNGDRMQERSALRAASDALAEYANNGGRHAKKAEKLSNEIAENSRSHVPASQINDWWNKVSNWTAETSPQG